MEKILGMLLDRDKDTPITEEVIVAAARKKNQSKQEHH
jgi:hypothetical protein